MLTKTNHDLKPDSRCCVAEGVSTQRDILKFKLVYLKNCAFHSQLWKDADAKDRAKEERREVGA